MTNDDRVGAVTDLMGARFKIIGLSVLLGFICLTNGAPLPDEDELLIPQWKISFDQAVKNATMIVEATVLDMGPTDAFSHGVRWYDEAKFTVEKVLMSRARDFIARPGYVIATRVAIAVALPAPKPGEKFIIFLERGHFVHEDPETDVVKMLRTTPKNEAKVEAAIAAAH
jgi:hypothetical protein